ncbi:MAG: hypothetical protein ACOYLS_07175 [Polymorphobacter sp.]
MIGMFLLALLASTSDLDQLSKSLDQNFETLHKSRLSAEQSLQQNGKLSDEQIKAVRNSVDNANALWIGCLRVGIWKGENSQTPPAVLLDKTFRSCQSRRVEMSRWVKLTASVMKFNDSDTEVEKIMAEFERINRNYATKLLASR